MTPTLQRHLDLLRDDPVESVRHTRLDHGCDHAANRGLDRLVTLGQRLGATRRHPHPYLFFLDLGTAATGVMAATLAWRTDGVGLARMALLWLVVSFGYEAFLSFKAQLSGERSRHYVRDLTCYWVPAFVVGALAIGIPWRFALGYAGLHLSLWCGIVRLGCFVGGCCFGVPCRRVGVLYRPEQLYGSDRPGRRYRPGPFLGRRVFPLPLVAAAVNLGLFGLLWSTVPAAGPDGTEFFAYMLFYAPFRFAAEYVRGDRKRTRRFTRTQRLLAAHVAVAVAALGLGIV